MKSFDDYCKDYKRGIQYLKTQNPCLKTFTKRCIWILDRWEKDNNLLASDIEKYVQSMMYVSKQDSYLYSELVLALKTISELKDVVTQDISEIINE